MKEHPILFSAPMVRAILDGTKTQTRRVVKAPLEIAAALAEMPSSAGWKWQGVTSAWGGLVRREDGGGTTSIPLRCPYGVVGDRLWVRETHAQFAVGDKSGLVPQCVAYRATCDEDGGFEYVNNGDEIMRLQVTKWTPAIFMPRWASRITLESIDVRVQRLQEITEDDARAEGVSVGTMQDAVVNGEIGRVAFFSPTYAYAHLWQAINGDTAPWTSNPWVFAITFKRLDQPEQFGPPAVSA